MSFRRRRIDPTAKRHPASRGPIPPGFEPVDGTFWNPQLRTLLFEPPQFLAELDPHNRDEVLTLWMNAIGALRQQNPSQAQPAVPLHRNQPSHRVVPFPVPPRRK